MNDIGFGQYYPTNSPIHRLDPRAKLIFALLFMIFIFFVHSYTSMFAVFVFLLATTLIARIPIRAVLKCIKVVLFLLIFTGLLNLFLTKTGNVLASWWIFTITDEGISLAIMLTLRLTFLIIGTSLLTFTTTPMELTDGIESLLSPLKLIKVPVHDIALVMNIALRFIPTLSNETHKIMNAQKARGANIDTGKVHERIKSLVPILIPLFITAFRISDELTDALDARCYNATKHRTRLKKLTFTYRDLVAFIILTALICFIMVDKYYIGTFDSLLSGFDYLIYNFFKGLIG